MPKKTLTRNKKTGAWDRTVEALPSEVEQKNQGLAKPEKKTESQKSTKASK